MVQIHGMRLTGLLWMNRSKVHPHRRDPSKTPVDQAKIKAAEQALDERKRQADQKDRELEEKDRALQDKARGLSHYSWTFGWSERLWVRW